MSARAAPPASSAGRLSSDLTECRGGLDEAGGGSERIAVEAVDAAAEAEWDAFAAQSGGTLYHLYRWREVIAGVFGHESLYLLARDGDGRTAGVLPLVRLRSRLFGDFMVSLPYFNYGGLLAQSAAAARSLLEEAVNRAAALGAEHIELRHRSDVRLDLPAREDKVALWLELPTSEEALWQSFKSKLRAQIRRPEKDGAVLREGGIERLDDFYFVFARNMRDLGTPVYPKRFFSTVVLAFEQQTKIFTVELNGKPVAGGLVLAHGSTVEVPWASSLREANPTGVNMLLYWGMLRDAVRRGFSCFDFGRSTQDTGTYRFELQWGAQPERLRWHYWLPDGKPLPRLTPNNPKYRTAIALWRRLPLPVANILGPRIVKNLP